MYVMSRDTYVYLFCQTFISNISAILASFLDLMTVLA